MSLFRRTARFAPFAALAMLFVGSVGTPAHAREVDPHRSLAVAHLTPEISAVTATVRLPLTMVAVPVQLGTYAGLATNADGSRLPVNVQMSRIGELEAPAATNEAQILYDDENTPYLDRHTVPMLPYGSFLVAVRNTSTHAITIEPQQLSMVVDGKRHAVIADAGAIFGRYLLTLQGDGRHLVGESARAQISAKLMGPTPLLKGTLRLAAGQSWQGYAVFDVGAYTADEYNAFLGRAQYLALELREPKSDAVAAVFPFEIARAALSSVCVPGAEPLTFTTCEVTP